MKFLNCFFRVSAAAFSAYLVHDVFTRKEEPLSPDIPAVWSGRVGKPMTLFLAAIFAYVAYTDLD
jgi:hypothetical protein